jgi:hypothetical protein
MSYSKAINKMKRAFIKSQVSMDTFQPSRGITITPVGEAKPGNLSHPYYWAPFVYYGKTQTQQASKPAPASEVLIEKDIERLLTPESFSNN